MADKINDECMKQFALRIVRANFKEVCFYFMQINCFQYVVLIAQFSVDKFARSTRIRKLSKELLLDIMVDISEKLAIKANGHGAHEQHTSASTLMSTSIMSTAGGMSSLSMSSPFGHSPLSLSPSPSPASLKTLPLAVTHNGMPTAARQSYVVQQYQSVANNENL